MMFRRLKPLTTTVVILAAFAAHTLNVPTHTTAIADFNVMTTIDPAGIRLDQGKNFAIKNLTNSSPISCASVHRSIDEFPADFFTEKQRRHGAIIIHLILTFYGFLFITSVCQDYFLPSVFCISIDLGLSPDVAGATFMAAATCTSELLVSVIGTFVTKSDLGVGTVVGSGVYNTLGVSACVGLAASQGIVINRWPLIRDSGVYVTSIVILAAIAVDNVVVWYEALVMVAMYFGYFVFLFTQHKLIAAVEKWKNDDYSFRSPISVFESIGRLLFCTKYDSIESQYTNVHGRDYTEIRQYGSVKHRLMQEDDQSSSKITFTPRTIDTGCDQSTVDKPTLPRAKSSWRNVLPIVWRTICSPVDFALWATIPDCRKKRALFPITFVASIVWVSFVTYVLSWILTICGDTFHVSDVVMGIAVLAVGSSIPEAASGIINAKTGEGSMSISSALGSNTMDILLCLGLPWFIKCTLPLSMNGGPVTLQTDTLFFNCMCMIASVVVLNVAAAINGYKMHKSFGVMCLVGQTVVIVVLIVNGLNVSKDDNGQCH